MKLMKLMKLMKSEVKKQKKVFQFGSFLAFTESTGIEQEFKTERQKWKGIFMLLEQTTASSLLFLNLCAFCCCCSFDRNTSAVEKDSVFTTLFVFRTKTNDFVRIKIGFNPRSIGRGT